MPRPVVTFLRMARSSDPGACAEGSPFSDAPCTDCAAPCCASLRARLTTVEALRIAGGLAVPLDDVVERIPDADQHHPWFTVPLPVNGGYETLALRRTDPGACQFLHAVGTRGRCAIHSLRAGVCRLYPYDVSYRGKHVVVGDQELCPRAWLVGADTPRRVRRDLDGWLRDLAAERDLVSAWSRRPRAGRTWPAFVDFAQRRARPR